jgi:hypothetical protein
VYLLSTQWVIGHLGSPVNRDEVAVGAQAVLKVADHDLEIC